MHENLNVVTASAAPADPEDNAGTLRQLGARAHQLRAATQAADFFNASDDAVDHDTACWLVSGALMLADEVALDLDNLARSMKDRPVDAALRSTVSQLRIRAHQLHAAARAADHYLEQDTRDDREVGGWLVTTAMEMARRLAAELDDSLAPSVRRAPAEHVEPHDAALVRRVAAAATHVVRGAA